MIVHVEIPDEVAPSFTKLYKAVLDVVEPGASDHCVAIPCGTTIDEVRHPRLDVLITRWDGPTGRPSSL